MLTFPTTEVLTNAFEVFFFLLLLVGFVFVLIRGIRTRNGKENISFNYRYYDSVLGKSESVI